MTAGERLLTKRQQEMLDAYTFHRQRHSIVDSMMMVTVEFRVSPPFVAEAVGMLKWYRENRPIVNTAWAFTRSNLV